MLELAGGYGLSLNDRLGVGFNNMHKDILRSLKRMRKGWYRPSKKFER